MGKRKIEINVPENLDRLIDSLSKFLHKKPEYILRQIALDAVKALPENLGKYIDVAMIRKIYKC